MPRIRLSVFVPGLAFAFTACASATATVGEGDLKYSVPDTGAENETDAKIIGLRLDTDSNGKSAGIEGELVLSDDDLFGSSELRALEGTLFVEWEKESSAAFRTTLLLGLDYHISKTDSPGGELTWDTVGLKAALGPELDLLRTAKRALTLSLEGSYMLGLSTAEAGSVESSSLDTDARLFGLEAMLAYGASSSFSIGAGALFQKFAVDTVEDDAGLGDIPGIETELTALILRAQIYL